MNMIYLPANQIKLGLIIEYDLDNIDNVKKLNEPTYITNNHNSLLLNPRAFKRIENAIIKHKLTSNIETMKVTKDDKQ